MTLRQAIGAQVRRYREKRGWSQDVFGEKLAPYTGQAWSRQAVSKAENGGRAFDMDDLVNIAQTFGDVSVPELCLSLESVTLAGGRVMQRDDVFDLLLPPLGSLTGEGAVSATRGQKRVLEMLRDTLDEISEGQAASAQAVTRAQEYWNYLWVPFADQPADEGGRENG